METSTIREEVLNRAPNTRCIWPNGMGYNWRGWEYSYGHQGWAVIPGNDDPHDSRIGRGPTPEAALMNLKGIPVPNAPAAYPVQDVMAETAYGLTQKLTYPVRVF